MYNLGYIVLCILCASHIADGRRHARHTARTTLSPQSLLHHNNNVYDNDVIITAPSLLSIESEIKNKRSKVDRTMEGRQQLQIQVEEAWSPTAKWQWADTDAQGVAPMKREGHTAVSLDGMLIVFGGCYLDKQCFNDVHVFFANKKLWVPVKTMGQPPAEREGHTSTMVGDRMFVYGGSSQLGYLDDAYVLKTSLSGLTGEELVMAWGRPDVGSMVSSSENLPAGREGHTGTLVGSRIFYFGGYTERGFTNELLILDTSSMSWEQPHVSSLKPPAREGHSSSLYNDRMYVWGGFTDGGCLNDLWILDVGTVAWEVRVTAALGWREHL